MLRFKDCTYVMKLTASDVLAASMLCISSSERDFEMLVWNDAISLPNNVPNLLKVSLCQESYFSDTLLCTLAKSITIGPNSRRVSEVSKVVRVFLNKKKRHTWIRNYKFQINLLNVVQTLHPFAYVFSQHSIQVICL